MSQIERTTFYEYEDMADVHRLKKNIYIKNICRITKIIGVAVGEVERFKYLEYLP